MVRAYDDPCGLARALNLLGDRWALLVVRELLLGPKRFGELRRGLPGASQSMLTRRLTELEQAGVLRRHRLGPPVSTWAYELTRRGRDLEPALVQLARWGSRTALTSQAQLSVDALALAMKTTFDAAAAGNLGARCELGLDDDRLLVTIGDGRLDVARGGVDAPDAVIETSVAVFRELIFAGASVTAAERSGEVTVRGDREVVARLLTLFPRPAPDAAQA